MWQHDFADDGTVRTKHERLGDTKLNRCDLKAKNDYFFAVTFIHSILASSPEMNHTH